MYLLKYFEWVSKQNKTKQNTLGVLLKACSVPFQVYDNRYYFYTNLALCTVCDQ